MSFDPKTAVANVAIRRQVQTILEVARELNAQGRDTEAEALIEGAKALELKVAAN